MQRIYRDAEGLLMGGENVSVLMHNAGFADITVRRIKIEIDDWGPGTIPSFFYLYSPLPYFNLYPVHYIASPLCLVY